MKPLAGSTGFARRLLRLLLVSGVVLALSLSLNACNGEPTTTIIETPTTIPTNSSVPSPTIVPTSTSIISIFSQMPDQINPQARYVIFLHGRLVEEQGTQNPTDPRFGPYDYAGILNTLAMDGDQVISEERTANTDALEYVDYVVEQINTLLDAGVPPENISVVGFSKGGYLTILVSSQLDNDRINYVILASGCQVASLEEDESIVFHGRVLSIYEASDEYGLSCQEIADRSPKPLVFEEIRLDTGLAHGEFYLPRDKWIIPVLEWIQK
jgi:hypothetical protein